MYDTSRIWGEEANDYTRAPNVRAQTLAKTLIHFAAQEYGVSPLRIPSELHETSHLSKSSGLCASEPARRGKLG